MSSLLAGGDLLAAGQLQKMRVELTEPVSYKLRVGDTDIDLNALLGRSIALQFTGVINCLHCGRKTKKVSVRVFVIRAFNRSRNATAVSSRPNGVTGKPVHVASRHGPKRIAISRISFISRTHPGSRPVSRAAPRFRRVGSIKAQYKHCRFSAYRRGNNRAWSR